MWEDKDRSREGMRPQNCAANQNAGKCWQAPIKLKMRSRQEPGPEPAQMAEHVQSAQCGNTTDMLTFKGFYLRNIF